MKPKNLLMMSLVLLFAQATTLSAVPNEKNVPTQSPVHLVSSPELFEMVTNWTGEFNANQQGIEFTLNPVPAQGWQEMVQKEGTIAFVTKEFLTGIGDEAKWSMVVGRDVLVPLMSTENPFREEILQTGVSPEAFSRIYTSSGIQTWGSLINNNSTAPVHPYVVEGKSSYAYLADFINTDTREITARSMAGTEKMVEAIQSDPYAIGFCRLADILSLSGEEITSGLSLIPVDLNGNAAIDKMEDIYRSVKDLTHGIWLGKYPRELYSRLYAVANSRPERDEELAFLEWLVSDGQPLLAANGYISLNRSEKFIRGEQLADKARIALEIPVTNSSFKVLSVVLGGIFILGLILFLIAKLIGRSVSESGEETVQSLSYFGEKSVPVPGGLFFDKTHTWAFMEKDGKVRIGIDEFLSHVTGPITRIIMKNAGERIKKGEPFLTLVQEGKKLEIQSPVSGTVVELNRTLLTDSSGINAGPYEEGWVYVVEPLNWLSELKAYLMGEKYSEWISKEFFRLKDFLSSGIGNLGLAEPVKVLQAGGELKEGVLEDFGPEVWEEFQTGFINRSV